MTNNADAVTLELIKQVQAKRDEIAKVSRPQWKTNCIFTFPGASKSINLHIQADLKTLVSMAAVLLSHKDYYEKALVLLNQKDLTPDWYGSTVDDWIEDIQTRIGIVGLNKKRQQLKLLEDRLDLIISPELKRQMEIEAIQKELND
jgi:hypothetical protein